jgi:hypothetical protein
MTFHIEIVVALPSDYRSLRSTVEARLRERFSDAEVTFEDADSGDCHVKSVTVPKEQNITDASTGEDLAAEATASTAQQIVSAICWNEREGKQ